MTKRFLSGALIDMDSAIIFRGAKVKAVKQSYEEALGLCQGTSIYDVH